MFLYVVVDRVELDPIGGESQMDEVLQASAPMSEEFGLDVAARVREIVDSTGEVTGYAIFIDPEGFEG